MSMLIALIGIIFIIGSIVTTIIMRKNYFTTISSVIIPSIVCIIVGILLITASCLYAQDPGEVVVLKNITGSVDGSTAEAGLHTKLPWQDTINYDVRNITISFIGTSKEDYTGGAAIGPHITINDAGGASADMDVQVQYSLNPNNAVELYTKYGSQENFVRQIVAVGTRTYARDVAGKLSTIDILTSRGAFSEALKNTLTAAWEDDGVLVENVAVQDIRYPDSIKDKYADAQAAEIQKAKAENEQKAAQVEAETKRIAAEGEANANRVLAESLNQNILTNRYIEALQAAAEHGCLIIVPEGSTPFITAPSQS